MKRSERLTHQAEALAGIATMLWAGRNENLMGAAFDTCASVGAAVVIMRDTAEMLRRDAKQLEDAGE